MEDKKNKFKDKHIFQLARQDTWKIVFYFSPHDDTEKHFVNKNMVEIIEQNWRMPNYFFFLS